METLFLCESTPTHIGPLHLSNSDKNSNDLYTCMSVCNSNAITDHTECSPIIGGLLFLFLHFKDVKIAALLDSGSTTNLKVLVMLIKRWLIHF